MGRSYFRPGFSVLLAAVLVAGCSTTRTTSGGAVGVERERMMLVSSAEVNRSAEKAYQQTIHAEQAKNHLNRDAAQLQRVRRIAGGLIPVTAAFRTDAPGWRWEVKRHQFERTQCLVHAGRQDGRLYRPHRTTSCQRR